MPAIGLIGPSGGLDDGEREAALSAGILPVRLSDGRLRTETAALAWAAWWSRRGLRAAVLGRIRCAGAGWGPGRGPGVTGGLTLGGARP